MTSNRQEQVAIEIRLDGHLDPHWSGWFGDLVLTHQSDGCTTLRGTVADQAQLYGVLAQVRDLGATLISLTPLDIDRDGSTGGADQPDTPRCGRPHLPGIS
jgi:hypothetical protein